jgi:integrating conjugative element membrane protein (TIGR03747 family)
MTKAKSEQQRQADKTKRHGVFTKIVIFVMALPITVMVTMIISILLEWGLIWHCDDGPGTTVCSFSDFQPGMGVDHSRNMLRAEAGYVNQHFKDSLMGSAPVKVAGELITWTDDTIFRPIGIDDYIRKSNQEKGWAWNYFVSAYTIIKVVLLRLCVLFLSIPAYILFAVVGLVTGLVQRDLRKWGAGRESTDKFELSTKLISPSVVLCFVIYLSWPNSINPALIVVPFAAMFGYALHLTASNYKKYF